MREGRDRTRPIGVDLIDQAKEYLIVNRVTHLDQLADKLREPRVRRVIEPMLAGTALGEVPDGRSRLSGRSGPAAPRRRRRPGGRQPHLPRGAAAHVGERPPGLPAADQPDLAQRRRQPESRRACSTAFLAFWRQHGQPLLGSAPYHEIAPHLVLMAFLHRVVNGGGTLEREYAIGSGRMDLCLRYRGPDPGYGTEGLARRGRGPAGRGAGTTGRVSCRAWGWRPAGWSSSTGGPVSRRSPSAPRATRP